ncbi:MAG: hypothetical protein ACJ71Z_00390 [Aeromicrobium sp.]
MVNEDGDRGVFNWGLLGEIQADGLRAASALVERLVHLVDGPHDVADDSADAPPSVGPAGVDMGAVLPWFELWRDLVERTSETVQRLSGAATGPAGDGVQVGIDGSLAPTHPLVIALGTDGRGDGEMWLHNGTAADRGELVPLCGPLGDVDGNVLGCEVDIDPPKIDSLHARSSRGFAIGVRAQPDALPGTYRGVVQVRGAEAVWMPVEVTVPARPS